MCVPAPGALPSRSTTRRASAWMAQRAPSPSRPARFRVWKSFCAVGRRCATPMVGAPTDVATLPSAASEHVFRLQLLIHGLASAWLSLEPRHQQARCGVDTAYASAQPLGLLLAAWPSIKFAMWVDGRLSQRQSLITSIQPALIRPLACASLVGSAEYLEWQFLALPPLPPPSNMVVSVETQRYFSPPLGCYSSNSSWVFDCCVRCL